MWYNLTENWFFGRNGYIYEKWFVFQDKIVKDANSELDLYLTNPRELNETEKNELVDAVRKNAIEKRLVSVKKQEKIIFSQMCKAGISVDER